MKLGEGNPKVDYKVIGTGTGPACNSLAIKQIICLKGKSMTIAEIHGKISHTGRNLSEKMEDLLTSDVFSACRYVRPEILLIPFLGTAKTVDGQLLADLLPSDDIRVKYHFWPMLSASEPDLVIEINLSYIIMMEAKYLSAVDWSKSDPRDVMGSSIPHNQLERQRYDLQNIERYLKKSPESGTRKFQLLISAHRSIPSEGINKLSRPKEIFWTNWHSLFDILVTVGDPNAQEKLVLEDLMCLLKRKNLRKFSGFPETQLVWELISDAVYRPKMRKKLGAGDINLVTIESLCQKDVMSHEVSSLVLGSDNYPV